MKKKWLEKYSNILYLHFSKGYYSLPESAKDATSSRIALKRLLRILGYTCLRLLGNLFQRVEKSENLKGKVWLYVVSQNNYDSLKFLSDKLPDAEFVAGQSKDIGKYNKHVARLSLRRKLLYYYKFPSLLYQFLRNRPKSAIRFFDLLYDAVGFYEVYYRKLQRYRPAAVVFANDHNADARAMLLAAKDLGIKTIYIQHASVSSLFPPLSFDLNLLEGQDSLDKYRQCGPIPGRVELVGMPKADQYISYRNSSKRISTIGIGCNLMDNLSEIDKLLRLLSKKLPDIKLILRPHPRDTRNIAELARVAPNVCLSNSRIEPVFEYLRQLDVQISGTSGIHLEAVLLNVWSIYYDFSPSQQLDDYYGFIRHGLVDVAESSESLVENLREHLNTKPDVVGRAKYYSATLCTSDEGRSSEISIGHIRSFLKI